MFERTIATLGRLFRWGGSPPAEVERRVWVRHPCDVETTCQPAGEPQAEPLPVRVRNVSLGGASLEVRRPFAPGDLLSLRLPGDGEATTVLACVVRADDEGEGRWALGCTFSAEITEADLRRFATRRAGGREPEQRAADRYLCDSQATFQRVNHEEPLRQATVLNLSLVGVALRASAPLAVGELLNLELRSRSGSLVANPLACVVRVTDQPGGDWLFGCNFLNELTEEQVQDLL